MSGPDDMPEIVVANPLPVARRGVARLPPMALGAPSAVIDDGGARFPTQRDGDALLVELPLGALEARSLRAHDAAVAGARWEVGPTVLDNGRVRVELDRDGRIARWCVDGRFAPLDEPFGPVGWRADEIRVDAAGPVLARVVASGSGVSVGYALAAHADAIEVTSTGMPLALGLRGIAAVVVGDDGPGVALAETGTTGGWIALRRGDGELVAAIASSAPIAVERRGHALVVAAGAAIALRLPTRRGPAPLVTATALAAPFAVGDAPRPTALRLVDAGTLGIGRGAATRGPDDSNGLRLVETLGGAGRAWLFAAPIARAWRVDEAGIELGELPLSAERDAIQLDYAAHDVLLVRWR